MDRYLDHLVVERGVAANTAASYRRDLRRYRDYLIGRGIGDLAEVDESDVREFLVDLRSPGTGEPPPAPLSESSIARTLVATRGLHKFAVAEGIAGADPARAVRPPKPAQRLPKALSVADVDAILACTGGDDPMPDYDTPTIPPREAELIGRNQSLAAHIDCLNLQIAEQRQVIEDQQRAIREMQSRGNQLSLLEVRG